MITTILAVIGILAIIVAAIVFVLYKIFCDGPGPI